MFASYARNASAGTDAVAGTSQPSPASISDIDLLAAPWRAARKADSVLSINCGKPLMDTLTRTPRSTARVKASSKTLALSNATDNTLSALNCSMETKRG